MLLALALSTVLADQASKAYAVAHWKNAPPQMLLGGIFQIRYAENSGAFLSLFANLSPEFRFWFLTIGNGAMIGGLAAYLMSVRKISMPMFLALALLVGGGIGNLIDRVRFQFVIDFFYIEIGILHTGVFNIADMAITSAFVVMLVLAFQRESPAGEKTPEFVPGSRDGDRDAVPSPAAVEGRQS
jgi:signal peptidase II